MTDWKDKICIVTGAGTGIGMAVSQELARRGAIVYVTGITQDEADGVASEITTEGGRAIGTKVDVTKNSELDAIIQRAVSEQGTLDLMFNNAGLLFVGEYFDMDEDFIRKLIDVNVSAVYIGTLYAYRVMKEQGHGLIVNVASQGGLMPVGTMAAYSGTKHAVVGFTASVGGEAEAFGVDLKVVCPGNVKSEMLNKATTRGTTASKVLDILPEVMPTKEAATIIVDGMLAKKRKIILPWYSRVFSFIQRLWPEFGHKGAVDSITKFRNARTEENQY